MPHLADPVDAPSQHARKPMLWVLLGALAAGQLFAFWLVCSHQVRVAEARHEEVLMQQMALSDCLRYIPGATIASCSGRTDADMPAMQPAANPALGAAVPVSFTYR